MIHVVDLVYNHKMNSQIHQGQNLHIFVLWETWVGEDSLFKENFSLLN